MVVLRCTRHLKKYSVKSKNVDPTRKNGLKLGNPNFVWMMD